ncbi:probable membrane-associated kinase regulator 6 [Rutidosis leptorrhynchoides]|uniref:probable membrane-associated kinase regulator 6 n=1 Tax=Rutidosis leptorrhynchoides TaxID=125765 RepID=UPI003A993D6B
METKESLSIESFSYSWLVNLKPSFESPKGSFRASFDAFDDSNFIEMDPRLSASQRFLVFHQDFNFSLPTLQPCVHADELISNGIVVPLFSNPLDLKIYDSNSSSTSASPVSSATPCSYRRSRSLSYKRLPKRVMQKYLNLFRLIFLRMRRRCESRLQRTKNCESSGTIDPCGSDNWSRSWEFECVKNYNLSPRSKEYVADNWLRSYDSESSIYEAVLHCKKTIGK